MSSETSNLKEEQTISLEERFNLGHVGLVVADADVLTHFKVRDLIEKAVFIHSHLTVINQDESNSTFQGSLVNASLSVFELLFRDSQSNAFDVEVLSNIEEPRAPSTSEIK